MLETYLGNSPNDCVFIHGAGGNFLFWKRTIQFLDGKKRAIAINLPGHPRGDITCRSIEEYADAVHQFVADASLNRPVICGHSMGSAVSLMLALRHPEDVGGLILIGSGAKLGVDPKIVEGLRTEPMKTIERTITPMSYFAIDLGMGREARATLSFDNLPIFLNDYLCCDAFDVRNRLDQVTAETLLICGEQDRMTPPKWSQYLKSNILSSSLYFVKDAGHMVPLEKPESVAKLVQSFLSGFSR